MAQTNSLNSQQSGAARIGASAPGTWILGAGQALTLRPRRAGVLRVARGRVWATLDGPHPGPANDRGDLVLGVGEELVLGEGQNAVLEDWDHKADAQFAWDPLPVATPLPAQPSRWQANVAQPTRELTLALGLVGHALGRLFWGLAGYSEYLVAGRGRVQPCWHANQP